MQQPRTIYDIPRDVLNVIKDMLHPRDYFRVLQVAWLFHDPNTELQRQLMKTRQVAAELSKALCGRCGNACSRCKEAPKKPRSAFVFFVKATRPALHQEYPNLSFAELTREVANQWQNLPLRQRIYYQNKQDEDKHRYEREMEEYAPERKKNTPWP